MVLYVGGASFSPVREASWFAMVVAGGSSLPVASRRQDTLHRDWGKGGAADVRSREAISYFQILLRAVPPCTSI